MKAMKYKVEKFDLNEESKKCDSVVVNIVNHSDNHENLKKIDKSLKTDDDNTSNSLNEDEVIDDNLSETAVVVLDDNKSNKIENLEIILLSTSLFTSTSSEIAVQPKSSSNNSDTASSSESGFGTVDDENENNNNAKTQSIMPIANQYKPFQSFQNQDLSNNKSNKADESTNRENNNDKFQQHQIRIPNIQGPRQIIYQLNSNSNSDDIANILTSNDNSSINSSLSSSSNRFNNCCSSIMENLNRCYYSCFCCYSTTSHTNQTPFIWSWLSVFCCCCPILGCISLYLSNRSKKFKLKQKYDLAEKYSNYAEKLNIASLIFGVIFYAIIFFLICIFIFMHWRQTKT